MKMSILELEYKNIRKISSLQISFRNDTGGVIKNNFVMMANGTGKTTTMTLIKGLLDGSAKNWPVDYVKSFAPTTTTGDKGEFSITVKFDEKQYKYFLSLDYVNGIAKIETQAPPKGRETGLLLPTAIKGIFTPEFVSRFVFDGEQAKKSMDRTSNEADETIRYLYRLDELDEILAMNMNILTEIQNAEGGSTGTRGSLSNLRSRQKKVRDHIASLEKKQKQLNGDIARFSQEKIEKEKQRQELDKNYEALNKEKNEVIAEQEKNRGNVDVKITEIVSLVKTPYLVSEGLCTVQDAWDEILQDEPKQIEQFLRYYYASACGSRVGRTSLYDDFLKQFFPDIVDVDDVSDEATATKIVDTVNQILREIRTYRKLIAGIWPYEVGQPLTDWDRKRLDILIRFLDFDIVYPLLLAAVQLKQKTFADLVHMLEKFMFRHKSVCNLGHQKLSELYMQEAVKIRRDPENYRLTGLRTTLKEYIETECTDAVFKVGLSNLKYRTNGGNKPLRYLFSTLNEHIEWYRNGAVGAPAPQKGTVINYDNVTIEHIASQSPSAAVPGFTSENIHTLSNLTLLTNGENDRAKNKSYTAKKAIYHDSEYVINKYFDSVDDWSVESAKAWEQYLQEMVCKVFVV